MRFAPRDICFAVVVVFLVISPEGANCKMKQEAIVLPKTIQSWTSSGPPQRIEASGIFKYMNGGGELYLAYGFDHLEVFEYKAEGQANIVAELYYMRGSNDAFGLFSLDWDGEPVELSSSSATGQPGQKDSRVPPARALYGRGLLRLVAGKVFARVLANRETPEARKAVLGLGEVIASSAGSSLEPAMLKMLPLAVGQDWTLRKERAGYFRSHMVLNSLFYLSHENILDLGQKTEGVTSSYAYAKQAKTQAQFVCVKYPDALSAKKALAHFHSAYLPEHQQDTDELTVKTFKAEHAWLGYGLKKKYLALVFNVPTQKAAQQFIELSPCSNGAKDSVHEK